MKTENRNQIFNLNTWSFAEFRSNIYDFKEKYPFAQYSVSGRSWSGRAIFSLCIGEGSEDVLYIGGFDAGDSLSAMMLIKFFERICESYSKGGELCRVNIAEVLKDRNLIIIPCPNPDGMQIRYSGAAGAGCYGGFAERISSGDFSAWTANARGVEINRNFNCEWELAKTKECMEEYPSPFLRGYAGQFPESEPETQAVTRLCRNRSIRHAVSLHNTSEGISWKHGNKTPGKAGMMAKILAASGNYEAISDDFYEEGCGSFKNWFINEFSRPAFHIGIGSKRSSFSHEGINKLYAGLEEMLLFALLM